MQNNYRPPIVDSDHVTLDQFQIAVVRHIDAAVSLRQQYYDNHYSSSTDQVFSESNSDSDSESESNDDSDHDFFTVEPQHRSSNSTHSMHAVNPDINWQQPILLAGKPGSGKSEAIAHSIFKHVAMHQNILVFPRFFTYNATPIFALVVSL